jgi:hypothetical protein
VFAPQANQQTIGHQIAVLPDGTLVDSFTLLNGSGNQPAKAAQNSLAIIRSTDKGVTWSAPIIGPSIQPLAVTDPDTGASVRTGEILADFAVDPNNGNLYLVWSDARFSNFKHNDIAFAMSSDGGLTWSTPIKINQAPTALADGNQQAFVPSVAVAANGTVAVTYYDFRNNTGAPGVPTDYWLVHAASAFTNPASWTRDEKRLTDTSFDLELAPSSGGFFLGDYEGLAAGGNRFYALFTQTGSGADGKSNIWFRDPVAAPEPAAALAACGTTYIIDSEGDLTTANLQTGETDTLGRTRVRMNDIAISPSGQLYGIDTGGSRGNTALYLIDPLTAKVRKVGSLGIYANALGFRDDGALLAASGHIIYQVNIQTGKATAVFNLPISYQSADDLAFDTLGNLFLTTTSGVLLRLNYDAAAMQYTSFQAVASTGYPDIFGLVYAEDGFLYAFASRVSPETILRIDPTTGVIDLVATIGAADVQGVFGAALC